MDVNFNERTADELIAELNDPDLVPIKEGHVCKHGIRWPHECKECAEAAWELYIKACKEFEHSTDHSTEPLPKEL